MMGRAKGMSKRIRVSGEGFGFDGFRNFWDVDVIVGCVAGDVPGSVEDGTKDFGLEKFDMLTHTTGIIGYASQNFINLN